MNSDELLKEIKKSLLKQKKVSAKYGFDVSKHWKHMLNFINKEESENDLFKNLPILKKSKVDYGQISIEALKRATNKKG